MVKEFLAFAVFTFRRFFKTPSIPYALSTGSFACNQRKLSGFSTRKASHGAQCLEKTASCTQHSPAPPLAACVLGISSCGPAPWICAAGSEAPSSLARVSAENAVAHHLSTHFRLTTHRHTLCVCCHGSKFKLFAMRRF